MNDNVIFVDTETTGLDPDRHEVWDVAIIEADGTEHEWHIKPHLATADPGALRITHFYERTGSSDWAWAVRGTAGDGESLTGRHISAIQIAQMTANKHLVGAVPWFDAAFLDRLIRSQGGCPAWHYHMIDVETLAIGYLRGRQKRAGRSASGLVVPPWDSHALSDALGIDSSSFGERHTAIADARWARAIYEKVMGG